MRLFAVLVILSIFVSIIEAWIDQDRQIENAILKKYNRKHRPVKDEATTMHIDVFLMINHLEKVDEKEQTLLVHGQISSVWNDEYLKWDPKNFNQTSMISIDTWKIWQPTFALYNSARSNGWYLNMAGVPATLDSNGKVYSSGSFSFYVTCVFDFSNYPYDVQRCPIVIADWVYDLSKINLSDPNPLTAAKPALRLSFDPSPDEGGPKKHVAGWEVTDTWRNHCYWGPKGCLENDVPSGPLDIYWSLLEFGIELKRHAPYFGITILMPTLIASFLTLMLFWIDDYYMTMSLAMLNILFQSVCGWGMLKQLPPSNGQPPRIALYYAFNFGLTAFAYAIHSLFNFFVVTLPGDIEFPFQLTNVTELLRKIKFFNIQGFSFDPNKVVLGGEAEKPLENHNEPVETNHVASKESTIVDIEDAAPSASHPSETKEDPQGEEIAIVLDEPYSVAPEDTLTSLDQKLAKDQSSPDKPEKVTISNESHLAEELYTIRRIIFALYCIAYAVLIYLLIC